MVVGQVDLLNIERNSILALASLARSTSTLAGGGYTLTERVLGEGFYDSFKFENIPDPTNGRVTYVDRTTAQNLNLTYATSDTFILRADHTTVLNPSSTGRSSVRIRSHHEYYEHVVVFDVQHMPEGCGTWPAIWETGEFDWPAKGEIDILEGVNNVVPNQSTLHTSHNCSMPGDTTQSGTFKTTDCDTSVAGNAGCAVKLTQDMNSFGPGFNRNGGGWYAMERTPHHIKVWFWERSDPSVPLDVSRGESIINTIHWGTPGAHFPSTQCDFQSHFGGNSIIINLTFCGDWAGDAAAYSASGCPLDCVTYVDNNPKAFRNAYFQISSMNIYKWTPQGPISCVVFIFPLSNPRKKSLGQWVKNNHCR
ncbi:glycoside hydrolase family 16 protein [Suillus spraguei]|nr:glycoside hydrolase family 16 protein [Suillus spraguei]